MTAEPTLDRLRELSAPLLERCTFPEPGTHVRCALSGGADSSALVALAVAAGCVVEAVHVDHGLRATSADDAECAADTADRFGVPLHVERIVLADGANLEARARDARRAVIGPDALTGHTADDQAETVLLAVLRGSGTTGLAGMRAGPTKPMLALRRTETHALCQALDLQVADDASNREPRFRRNRVRHELLPLMDDVAGRDVVALLARTAELLRHDDDHLEQLASELDPTDARGLASAPVALARRAVRRWLLVDGYPPDAATVERVLAVAAGVAVGCDVGGGRSVRRRAGRLHLFRADGSRQ